MNCRPSELYHLDGLEAYAFDSAIARWGMSFEAALQSAVNDAKDQKAAETAHRRVMRAWLPETRKFRDPAKE